MKEDGLKLLVSP